MLKIISLSLLLSLVLSYPVLAEESEEKQCYSVEQIAKDFKDAELSVNVLRLSEEQAARVLNGLNYPAGRGDIGEVVAFVMDTYGVDVVVFDNQGCYVRDKFISFSTYQHIITGKDV